MWVGCCGFVALFGLVYFFCRPETVGVVGGGGGRPLLRWHAAGFWVLCCGCGGVEYLGYHEESLGLPQLRLRQPLRIPFDEQVRNCAVVARSFFILVCRFVRTRLMREGAGGWVWWRRPTGDWECHNQESDPWERTVCRVDPRPVQRSRGALKPKRGYGTSLSFALR